MRIALVHMRHAEVGGTETFLDRLARHLGDAGHDVTIVCRRHGLAPHPRARFAVLHGAAVGSAWRAWRFAQDVERHVAGARYDLVVALGKTWTHDVIRCGGGCHQTYLDLADRFARSPLERALGLGALKNRAALAIERRAYAPAANRRVIAISDMVRRDLIARYAIPADRVELIHNGVDLQRFHPRHRAAGAALRQRLGIAPDALLLLFLGSGFGRKGLAPLLRAFRPLHARRPGTHLLVVGREGGEGHHEPLAQQLGLRSAVTFLGESREPETCYAASDLYVLPTRYDAFAFTVLEALATGLPVITTDRAGAAELLGPAQGQVVAAQGLDDAAGLAALEQALDAWCDRERLAAAAPAARALAEQHPFERSLEQTTAVLMRAAAEVGRDGARLGAPPVTAGDSALR